MTRALRGVFAGPALLTGRNRRNEKIYIACPTLPRMYFPNLFLLVTLNTGHKNWEQRTLRDRTIPEKSMLALQQFSWHYKF